VIVFVVAPNDELVVVRFSGAHAKDTGQAPQLKIGRKESIHQT
jgi:hypothetical protein